MRRAVPLLAPIILIAALAPRPATAQTEQDAHTLVRDGRYREAVAAFERLYAQQPQPRLLLNIAAIYTLYMPGRCPDALGALERFFIVCEACALRAEAEKLQARTRRTCVGRLTIETAPPGARIRVDDGPETIAPATVELVEGGHVVSASMEGHHAVEQSIVVRGGEADRLEIELRPLADPAEVLFTRGRALVDDGQTAAALAAFTEGEALESSPRFALEVARSALALGDCPRSAAALDRLASRCSDCPLRTQGAQVRVAHAATCAPPAPVDDGLSPWVWTSAAVGGVGVAFGAIFHRQYLSAVDARDAAQARGESIVTLEALHEDAVVDYQLMQVGYAIGAAGLVGAGLIWWLDEPATVGSARLSVGAGGVGLAF